ncbi:MAG: hypothetical protein NC452_09640 [Eubacterium sp.]|nr:hypothetical protein [Eubacterium sp.]
MYNTKTLINACTAAVELAENYTANKLSTCRDIYHIVKFLRAQIRDFHADNAELNVLFDVLGAQAKRLRKIAKNKLTRHTIYNEYNEKFAFPTANACGSLLKLVKRKFKEKDVESFPFLYQITAFYVPWFLRCSDAVCTDPNPEIAKMQMNMHRMFCSSLWKYIICMEFIMEDRGIEYERTFLKRRILCQNRLTN